jgi:hypothetical protein
MKPKKCKDGFNTYMKRRTYYNEQQTFFIWRIWQTAWSQGKMFGVEEHKNLIENKGRRSFKPLLTYEQMKELWNKNAGGTGRTFGIAIEKYYGLRKRGDDA